MDQLHEEFKFPETRSTEIRQTLSLSTLACQLSVWNYLQCGEIEFFVIFGGYVISISIKVKFTVSHFDGYKHWGCSSFMHIKGAWGTKNACDGW